MGKQGSSVSRDTTRWWLRGPLLAPCPHLLSQRPGGLPGVAHSLIKDKIAPPRTAWSPGAPGGNPSDGGALMMSCLSIRHTRNYHSRGTVTVLSAFFLQNKTCEEKRGDYLKHGGLFARAISEGIGEHTWGADSHFDGSHVGQRPLLGHCISEYEKLLEEA